MAPSFEGQLVAVGTMHEKERVIAPVLRDHLALRPVVPDGLDTDRFGTFTREVQRSGSQLDAARSKALAALDRTPRARFAIASEGSFGPHPHVPFVPGGREIVVLLAPEWGLEVVGQDTTHETNYASAKVTNALEALRFAERVRFPTHGIVAMAVENGEPAPRLGIIKGITAPAALFDGVRELLRVGDSVHLESDMRAHVNPTRMRSIKRATLDLVRRTRSECPRCGLPGFHVKEIVKGLPCRECGTATSMVMHEVLRCDGCDHRKERPPAHGLFVAPPSYCDECNP